MPKIGTHALDVLGHVPCRQVGSGPESVFLPDPRQTKKRELSEDRQTLIDMAKHFGVELDTFNQED